MKIKTPEWKVMPELLLGATIPKPMFGLAPRVVLGDNWWNRTRRACYASTMLHCQSCGVHKLDARYHQWLEAHELYEIDYIKGRMVYTRAVPLCHFCHNYVHIGRLEWLLQTGAIHHDKFAKIIQHGELVLRRARLDPKVRDNRTRELIDLELRGLSAKWSDWRLVVDGVEYPPKFKSYEEWLRHYASEDGMVDMSG